MILLITSSARAAECAAALRESSGEAVECAGDLPRASSALRAQEFSTVIFDDSMLELDPAAEEFLLPQCGTATAIHVNLALCGQDRLIREVRLAQHRRQHDELLARQSAEAKLRSELNDPLTALRLSCELALEERGLPDSAATRVRIICDLATRLCEQLGIIAEAHAA